jgi:multidrug resistance efflux pump
MGETERAMRTKIIIGAVLLALVGAGVGYWIWSLSNHNVLVLPGVVEVQEVRLGSKVGGRVESVLIGEGQTISGKGQTLIIFEAPELKNQRQQVAAKLESAKAELARLRESRPQEIKAAEAAKESARARWDKAVNGWTFEEKQQEFELKTAEADYEQAKKEWDRIVGLKRDKAVAQAEYDAAKGAYDRALGRQESTRFRNQMMKVVRPEEIKDAKREHDRTTALWKQLEVTYGPDMEIAEAKVAELQANLDAIDINLAETRIVVPPNLGKAVVEVISVRPGDIAQPNQPVIRVLRVEDLWVKVYVPETQYGLITLHQKVDVTIDSYPGRIFKGTVEQRANISEFTPRNVQSVDERRHQVFGVKIRVDDPQGVFNAGMAAEVTIPLE